MKIGVIGGVGRMGGGLALRLAKNHEVLITSRNPEKAVQVAIDLDTVARGFHRDHMQGRISGTSNIEAVKQSETLIITIPAEHALPEMQDLKPYFHDGQIVISTVVSMRKAQGIFRHTPLSQPDPANCTADSAEQKSAAELIQEIIKPASVVSSFHTVPAPYLRNLDDVLNIDVFVAGDNEAAVSATAKLICEIPNLRPLRSGPLENSRPIESMVPLLLNVAALNHLKEPSIRVIPWIPTAYDGCS